MKITKTDGYKLWIEFLQTYVAVQILHYTLEEVGWDLLVG